MFVLPVLNHQQKEIWNIPPILMSREIELKILLDILVEQDKIDKVIIIKDIAKLFDYDVKIVLDLLFKENRLNQTEILKVIAKYLDSIDYDNRNERNKVNYLVKKEIEEKEIEEYLTKIEEKSFDRYIQQQPVWKKESVRLAKSSEIKIDLVILRMIKSLPNPLGIKLYLDDSIGKLYHESDSKLNNSRYVNVKLTTVLEIFHKILDIKNSIQSIGLTEGFILSRNLHDSKVYGVISNNANILISDEYKKTLKNELDTLDTLNNKDEIKKERRNLLGKALSDEICLYNLYHEEILISPMNKLMYFDLIIEIITIYLYVLSITLKEMVVLDIENEYSPKYDFEALVIFFFTRLSTSLRSKMERVKPKIKKQIFAGFDTEYKTVDFGKNKLVSAQLSISGNLLIEITTRTPYKFEVINTDTREVFPTKKEQYLTKLLIPTSVILNLYENLISLSRWFKFGCYDSCIDKLLSELKLDKRYSNSDDKKGIYLFQTPKIEIFRRLLLKDNPEVGLKWESLIWEIMEGSAINSELDHELFLFRKIYGVKNKGINNVKSLPSLIIDRKYEGCISERKLKDYRKTYVEIYNLDKKLNISVTNEIYLISHFSVADLSMIDDWDQVKVRNIDIIGKSFVSVMKPIKTKGYNIYIRDSMLLASAAAGNLATLGIVHGIRKKELKEEEITDMEWLLKNNPEKFKSYAMTDSDIVLAHSRFVFDFVFRLGYPKLPATLGSISRLTLKQYWCKAGYNGYQLNPEYPFGNPTKIVNPLAVTKLGSMGGAYTMALACYKGGRNESLSYGCDKKTRYFDWDLTSCYATVMYMLGHPDYEKSRYVSEGELLKMSDNDLKNSYTIMYAKIKHGLKIKYPIIPFLSKGEKANWVYSRTGEGYITGLEYIKLRHLKAEVNVKNAYYIPFQRDSNKLLINKPYADFIVHVQKMRKTYPKKSALERMWKDIGNMAYGSSVTGLSGKPRYSTRSNQMERLVGSDIANPLIGSWITSYVRSLIGETLNNIYAMGGRILSVTTDGFCCDDPEDVLSLEIPVEEATSTLTNVQYIESKILSFFKEDPTNIYFLNSTRQARLDITESIKGVGKGDASCYELKTSVTGMTQISTRVQCSNYVDETSEINKVVALTGFQRRGMTQKQVSETIDKIYHGSKQDSRRQFGLTGATDNYKKSYQCTPQYNIQKFSLKFDGRRRVIIPETIKKAYIDQGKTLPMDIMLDTQAFDTPEESTFDRGIMKAYKQSIYLRNATIPLLPSTRRSYESLNERSVLHDVLSGRPIELKELDRTKSDWGKKHEIQLDLPSAVELLAKFRNKFKKINKSLSEIAKDIYETEWGILSKKEILSKKQVLRLVSGLKVDSVYETNLAPVQKSGTYAELALNIFLSQSTEKFAWNKPITKLRFLPPLFRGGIC